jgi:DNA-binding transcriptional ArsR family regulator
MAHQLGPAAIVVYAALALGANRDGECWPSLATICKYCGGMSRSHVLRGLAALDGAGLISRVRRNGVINRYRLTTEPTSVTGGTGIADGTAPVPPVSKTSAAGDTQNKQRTKPRTNQTVVVGRNHDKDQRRNDDKDQFGKF